MKKDQRTIDTGVGEMKYVDPNDVNFPQNDEYSQISNNYIMRSLGVPKEDHLTSYRNEYERSQIETSQQMGYLNNRILQFSIDIEKKRKIISKSKNYKYKGINTGSPI